MTKQEAISILLDLCRKYHYKDIVVPCNAGKVLLSDRSLSSDLKGIGEKDFMMYGYKGEIYIIIQGTFDVDLMDWSDKVIIEFAKVMKKEFI